MSFCRGGSTFFVVEDQLLLQWKIHLFCHGGPTCFCHGGSICFTYFM